MATVGIVNKERVGTGTVELPDSIFGAEVKTHLMHHVVTAKLAAARAGTHDTKTRKDVRGGGKKPFRQKGTGSARQGCKRAPQYPGGVVAFGPQPKIYNVGMNKKARKAAIRSALSLLFKENKMTVLNAFDLGQISTKSFVGTLNGFNIAKTLLVIDGANRNLELSARNVKDVKVLKSEGLNVFDMLKYQSIIFTQDAVRKVEGALQS